MSDHDSVLGQPARSDLMHADDRGCFGAYGGRHLPPQLEDAIAEVAEQYALAAADPAFLREYDDLLAQYVGRPSPLFFARSLTRHAGGAKIYLKREDLNHTGSHKINHCLGEGLLAKRMGKTRLLAETGAGQHGVALATAAALLGLECEIHMGAIDVAKQRPNVVRMEMLGATVVAVDEGGRSLKEAVDSAFAAYARDYRDTFFAIGSVVGPDPYPTIVRDFQAVVGREARAQILAQEGTLPDALVACVGGGSNALGLFTAFLGDDEVAMYGVEPGGRGAAVGEHAATMTHGRPGMLHGMTTYVLQDDSGQPAPVHSIASGLDYPGVGPQHSYLKDSGRVSYVSVDDRDCLDAFALSCRAEGIIPALESAHAVAYTVQLAGRYGPDAVVIANLSGRGDKDIDYVHEVSSRG
ncbi:Tryptophan synthase beta chain [Austwickia sp. TVS 96-490-7B]|uniref:tryptophan synthase subunit beta n=1 Tax=Austwickia sp. TVS 96-490-7B TaxID=2830843 RepID=UPI001C59B290|nr:tryptophan synthase subunit beta [Austwickia sp. TVS 96-490-7B]MBW3084909.1 Tryptophan synthase beta chain [Austwickia sp. TVS 96-490-7B]